MKIQLFQAKFIFGSKCINLYQSLSKFCEVLSHFYNLCACILTALSHLIHFDSKMNDAIFS